MSLSVIIPVYRAERYLNRCMESIMNQKVEGMEVILVDDGSPDRSGELCDEWASRDSCVRVIHKQNGGAGSARNMALDIAQGTYITFVDSDDALADNTLQSLMSYLSSHQGVDILEYPAHLYIGSPKERHLTFEEKSFDITDTDATQRLWLEQMMYAHCYSCNKVFHRSLFDGIRYPETVSLGEDIRLISQLMKKARRYSTTNAGMYLYYFNGDSISGSLRYADQLLSSHLYAVEQLGIDIYSKAAQRLYLTLLNFQIDVYRFSKTKPQAPLLKNNAIGYRCARNSTELVKIFLLRLLGVRNMCRLLSSCTT